jgi:putative membrane protein
MAAHPGRETPKERIMSHRALPAVFITAITAAVAFAAPPGSGQPDTAKGRADASKKTPTLGEAMTVLHAVSQWSGELSQMADTKAKSDQVKEYARDVATANADKDTRLMALAKKHDIDVAPLDPQTEEGKSMLDRMKAEMVLLRSLEGDAFDKEYMTLVTNTQQSMIHFLARQKATAKDEDVKKFLGELEATVQKRVKRAQDIMAAVYGDSV